MARPSVGPSATAYSIVAAFMLCLIAAPVAQGKAHEERKIRVEHREGAFLGVKMQELSDELRKGLDASVKSGVVVTEVIDGSPAEKAGIEEGDIIVEFQGKKVNSPDELQKLVAEADIGDEVKIKLVRDKKSKTFEVTLGTWADNPTVVWGMGPNDFDVVVPDAGDLKAFVSAFRPRRLGVRVSEVNKDLGSYFGVKAGEGVLVLEVEEETTAAEMGMKAGDVIVKIEGEDIGSTEDIHETMSELDAGDDVAVTVMRKKKKVELKGEVKDTGGHWFQSWRGRPHRMRAFSAPEIRLHNEDLRKELDDLRKEIEALKKELKKS